MLTELLIILGLVLANGLFAGAEIAIVAVRPSRIQALAGAGNKSAKALVRLRSDPERFLSTVQIGITVISAAAAAFGGAAFASDLEPVFRALPILAEYAHQIAFTTVVALVSYLSLVLGELVPKSIGLRSSEKYAMLAAAPLLGLSWVVQPAVWFLTLSSNAVLRLFGDKTTFTESRLSIEELRTLVDEASQKGSVPPSAGSIVSRALGLSELTASDVMIHRRFVVGVSSDATLEELRKIVLSSGYQRIPVYQGSLDNVVGYFSWRDVLRRLWNDEQLVLKEMVRPCHFVPLTTSALALMEELRRQHVHLAIVVDEHGGMSGIVTLEDLLEELVGDIVSEHGHAATDAASRQADGSLLVPASAAIRDVNRDFGFQLEEPDGCSTMAGLCLYLAGGRIPGKGEILGPSNNVEIEITDASPRRVRSVRLRPAGSSKPT